MHIIVDAPPDPQRYVAAFRHMLRPVFIRVRVIGVIALLLGILEFFMPHLWQVGVILVLMGAMLLFVAPFNSIRTSIRSMPLALRQPQRYELTEQGVRLFSPLVTSQYAWAAFEKTEEFGGVLMLMLGRRQVVPVPLGGVPEPQLAELRQFLANLAFARQPVSRR